MGTFAQRIVDEADSFPYPHDTNRGDLFKEFYRFNVEGVGSIGYVHRDTALAFRDGPLLHGFWEGPFYETITLSGEHDSERSANLQNALEVLEELPVTNSKAPWWEGIETPMPVYSDDGEILFNIERAATRVFGVTDYSVTLIARTCLAGDRHYWVPNSDEQDPAAQKALKSFVSVPLRAKTRPLDLLTDAMLAQTGISARYTEFRGVGTISYHTLDDKYSQPHVQYIYEAVLEERDRAKIESKGYKLMADGAMEDDLKTGKFEPDAAMAYLDHFIRRGLVTIDNERNLVKIQSRLHRRLEWLAV